jgi:hypothetical protein
MHRSQPIRPSLTIHSSCLLRYHEVKLDLTFATDTEMAAVGVDTTFAPSATLFVTYAFLDTDERRRYAQTSHECEFFFLHANHPSPSPPFPKY